MLLGLEIDTIVTVSPHKVASESWLEVGSQSVLFLLISSCVQLLVKVKCHQILRDI